MVNLIFISENRNLYYRPKEVQEEAIKNLNREAIQFVLSLQLITTSYTHHQM